MKRCRLWSFLVLVTLLFPIALFANGGQEESSEQMESQEKITITWMKWGSPGGVTKRRDLLFSTFPELGDKYILEPIIGGKKPSDIAQKLRLSMSAGADIGDIVSITYPMLKEFATTGVLQDDASPRCLAILASIRAFGHACSPCIAESSLMDKPTTRRDLPDAYTP